MSRIQSFIVGVNMPWGAWCGHDFGLRPHGWGTATQDWRAVQSELEALRKLGVTVVRWFILASGVNYPCRSAAPLGRARADGSFPQPIDDCARRIDLSKRSQVIPSWTALVRRSDRFEWEWTREPSALGPEFLDDFVALCRACQAADVQLIPSLLSFEWFCPPEAKVGGVYGGGRRRLVFGPASAPEVRVHVRAFLHATLEPLIERTTQVFGLPIGAAPSKHPIFAWESINEPDWVTAGGPRLLRQPFHPVSTAAMNTFLAEFRELVLGAGYDHTIGFKQFAPRWLDPSLRERLIADRARYWHQGHHYPTFGVGAWLERSLATNRTLPERSREFERCLVGEFPTARGRVSFPPDHWTWGDPEVAKSEHDAQSYLHGRLQLMATRGYDGAMLWCAKNPAPDVRTSWSSNTQAQVARFVASQAQGAPRDASA